MQSKSDEITQVAKRLTKVAGDLFGAVDSRSDAALVIEINKALEVLDYATSHLKIVKNEVESDNTVR